MGTFVFADGVNLVGNAMPGGGTGQNRYVGYFENDRRHGTGRQYFDDGSQYIGEFRNNAMHDSDGRMYILRVRNEDGPNVYDRYMGAFTNGRREGLGRYIWGEHGEMYYGEFVNNRKHGFGTYFWPNGRYFEGEFYGGNLVRDEDTPEDLPPMQDPE